MIFLKNITWSERTVFFLIFFNIIFNNYFAIGRLGVSGKIYETFREVIIYACSKISEPCKESQVRPPDSLSSFEGSH